MRDCWCARFWWVALLIASAQAPPLTAQVVDSGYARLVRQITTESLRGAGHRVGEIYVATDSSTAALLLASGMQRVSVQAPPIRIECPSLGLTAAEVSPVGYGVTVTDSAGEDPLHRWLHISVGCGYASARRPGGRFDFAEWGVWEVQRAPTGWMVVRTLHHFIT